MAIILVVAVTGARLHPLDGTLHAALETAPLRHKAAAA